MSWLLRETSSAGGGGGAWGAMEPWMHCRTKRTQTHILRPFLLEFWTRLADRADRLPHVGATRQPSRAGRRVGIHLSTPSVNRRHLTLNARLDKSRLNPASFAHSKKEMMVERRTLKTEHNDIPS